MDWRGMQRFTLGVLLLMSAAQGRVLIDDSNDIQDFGSFLQYNGLNFSLNGNAATDKLDLPERYCVDGGNCSSDVTLPPEIEDRIYDLLHNVTLQNEEINRIKQHPRKTTSVDALAKDVPKPRKKRFLPFIIAAVVGCIALCGRGKKGSSGPVVDPHAKERFLLEKERTKMETIRFCLGTCAREWSQWASCDKQCGGGTQTRSRELIEPVGCVEKFKKYPELGEFECPYERSEVRPCNEQCPNGGQPNDGICTCFGTWGGTCCERELNCPFPGEPRNGGTVLGSSPSKVGSHVMYTCDPGYTLDSNAASYALCQRSQQWNNPLPTCSQILCSAPALTQSLEVLNPKNSYAFGETIHFKCAQGYTLQGPDTRACRDGADGSGQWSLYTPYCIKIECPAPTQADIVNGYVQGADYSYQSAITFHCHSGYELVGLSTLNCTKHGRWNGFYPTCSEITCPPPFPPENGGMELHGSDTVEFKCQIGYRLSDSSLRVAVCDDNGQWNRATPTCQPIDCDGTLINNVENGFVNGGIYRYPHSVTFECYPGYVLQGLDEISCQETGAWSGQPPTCYPCPLNTYMEEWSTGGVCTDCPANTYTATVGSTSRQQCLCSPGFRGPNGGPCEEVLCTLPDVPLHGTRGTCDLNVGQTCSFTCNAGFIPSSGASELECLSSGEWSNEPLSCSACPVDTYNPVNEPNVCLPCPEYMETEGRTGQGLEGCVCTGGWEGPAQPGEECEDINECSLMEDGVGCEDECVNTPGSFYCLCNRPGTHVDEDGLSCKVNASCRELTTEDAPTNGGLLCTHNIEESARFCSARCNDGFDFAGNRPNSYETCDASTQFKWSFEYAFINQNLNPADARLADCILEFVPGLRLEADVFYFKGLCSELTAVQQVEVKNAFIGVLESGLVCDRSPLSCAIDNVNIICGARFKRDIGGSLVESIDFNFNVTFERLRDKMKLSNCGSFVCPTFRIPPVYCERYCGLVINQYFKRASTQVRDRLEALKVNLDRVRFSVMDTEFEAESVHIYDDRCENGQQYFPETGYKLAYCVPCKNGHFLNDVGVCEACPAGTHQVFSAQTSCAACPLGSYSDVGWSYCLTCDEGFYGENCADSCTCEHGKCDSQTGECSCEPGWEGPNCSVDIDRCEGRICPSGSTCRDRPAPQDGSDCVLNNVIQ